MEIAGTFLLESVAGELAPGAVDILEDVSDPMAGGRVEGNVIRGVKLVGFKSQNPTMGYPTRYTAEGLKKAIPLYEGAPVHVDHPPRDNPSMERRYADRIGRTKNVRLAADGLRGDLVLNPEHGLTKKLLWDAQNEPDNVGLSHNVRAHGSVVSGEYAVADVAKVNGIDIVTRPSTTRGLFESVNPHLEATAAELVKSQVVQEASRRLVMDFMDLMHSIARSPLDPRTKKDQLRAAMQGLMAAMEEDMGADAKKVMESQGGQSAAPEKKADAPAPAAPKTELALMESRVLAAEERAAKSEKDVAEMRAELAAAKKKDKIHARAREKKLPASAMTPLFESVLMEAKDDAAIDAHIDERLRYVGQGVQHVESRASGPAPKASGVEVKDGKSFAKALGL